MYFPNNWVMIKIRRNERDFYKILGGWSGSYTTGDSWRINSGVAKASLNDQGYYEFEGYSGSRYFCHKDSNFVRMNIGYILENLLTNQGVELVPYDTNYLELKYE